MYWRLNERAAGHRSRAPPPPDSLAAQQPHALLRRQLALLAAAVFIVAAGYGGLMPVLPAWVAQYMPQADAAGVARHVGFLSGAYAAGVLVGALVWGFFSDRVGRGRIPLLGMVGFVASLLLLLLVPLLGGVAAIVPVVTAIVAAHTPTSLRARRFAWLGAVSLLGFLFGPALNAVVETLMASITGHGTAAIMSANFVIVFSAALGAAVMLGLALTLPPPAAGQTEADAGTGLERQQKLASLLALSGVATFVLAGFELGIVLQGQQTPASRRARWH